jgi:hypothetical protein
MEVLMHPLCDDPSFSHLTPLVLFAQLEFAVQRGDFAAAAEAQRELARRGIEVRYGCPGPRKAVASGS